MAGRPSSTSDAMQSVGDYLARVSTGPFPEAVRQVREFAPQYGRCEEHGEWQMNMLDEQGVERWLPDGCPKCKRQQKARSLIRRADIAPRFQSCSFDNYRTESDSQAHALNVCREYAATFRDQLTAGRCMILRGNPGTGKNHLSTAIMLQILNAGFSALRVKAASYLDEYWAKDFGERERWIVDMANVDLLVIDEIGRAPNTRAANDAFFRLIDERYEKLRPTIIVSNLDREELRGTLGAAAYDRLTEGGGRLLNFDWQSARAHRPT
ncbi:MULTISPECIES: ATP-binding protein [Burkholderia]|uniref:IstB ATP binding domain-containing protein n=1 Tax=Burkholderia aenigmatica TaxID=2015348 RepID=A0A6J5JJS9_9BURK|nr:MULTISPECIES: ATP-binding protein [Burkholderia]CAB3972276.1 IstB ATP binding domain-containing protein [Burkholderia aenigmatica]